MIIALTSVIITPNSATTETFTTDSAAISSIEEYHVDLQELIDYGYYSDQINSVYFQNIRNHIGNFSSFGSRVTGYPGYELAIDYIKGFFESQNLTDVQTLEYPHLVPLEYGTKIDINGRNYTAHTLVPNSVHASKALSSGLSGTLVYGGAGEYSDLDGKEIEEAIVILEFNSQDNWINVASLGAKAVIYLPPSNSNRFEAETKSIDIPLEFPRIYIDNKTLAGTIKTLGEQLNQSATIYSNIEWKKIKAKNILGILPGLDDDIIIISAYFDSTSCIPALSPGADEACGIATLLELIRIISDNHIVPQKTLMFLALSGHNQAAAGAREFVFQNYNRFNRNGGIKLFLSLDLSATTSSIGINPYGYLYKYQLRHTTVNNLFQRVKSVGEIFLQYALDIQRITNNSFNVDSYVNIEDRFENIAPIAFLGDQEPFIASNVLGLSFFSSGSSRIRYNTPFDLPKSLNFDDLKSQVIYSICALIQLIYDSQLDNYLDLRPKEFSLRPNRHVGFGVITGSCKVYNETSLWVENVANALIRVTSRNPNTDDVGLYSYYTMTDENGVYTIRGVSSSRPDRPLEFDVEAYTFNSVGNLIQANNLGPHGVFFDQSKKLLTKEITINPTVFSCGTLGLFQISHPFEPTISARSLSYQVLEPESRATHSSYGYKNGNSISLVFLPVNTRSIIIGTFPDKVLAVYATNSSSMHLRGNGFQVKMGEFKNLKFSTLITSRDLHSLTQTYISWFTSHSIFDQVLNAGFQNVSNQLSTINFLLQGYEYSKTLVELNNVQLLSLTVLKQARSIVEDSTATALLFAFFLIPFSFTLSLFLIDFNSGKKWIFVSCFIYSLAFGMFYFIHPGFQVAPYLVFALLGMINVLSIFLILYVFFQELTGFLKQLRKKTLGAHFIGSNQTGVMVLAFKTGILRMKKHRTRTVVNFSGIALLTFSLTIFTSTSFQVTSNFSEVAIPAAIAILLISNTALSNIFYAKREISIFTSLGVSPSNMLGIFFVEFLLHAIVGSLIGYSGGILFIRIFSTLGLITNSFTINYSSKTVIFTLLASGLSLLLSLIVPLRKSSLLSVPSRRRAWQISSLPEGDGTRWKIVLPFIFFSEEEAEGILAFLREFFLIYESESVGGPFFVRSPIIFKNNEGKEKQLLTSVNLAPFDMGIIQKVNLSTYYDAKKDHWKLIIKLTRLEGVLQTWYALVKRFIGIIRMQLFLWKDLPNEEKVMCIEAFKKEFSSLQKFQSLSSKYGK